MCNHCLWTIKEEHRPNQILLGRHMMFHQLYRSQGELHMEVTMEVLIIGTCHLISMIMLKRHILLLLILEVGYFWWCLELENLYVELIHGYLAGRAHELGIFVPK